jgi:hypothetical protein
MAARLPGLQIDKNIFAPNPAQGRKPATYPPALDFDTVALEIRSV